jgi:hypothetical protein
VEAVDLAVLLVTVVALEVSVTEMEVLEVMQDITVALVVQVEEVVQQPF